MSLTTDFLYPQYLVVVFLRDEKGDIVDFDSSTVFATRSSALSFISSRSKELSWHLRGSAFSPVFRLYHLTRAKI